VLAVAFLSAFIANFSLSISLIFIIAYAGKNLLTLKYNPLIFFIVLFSVIAVLAALNFKGIPDTLNITVGLGFTFYIFYRYISRTWDFLGVLYLICTVNFIYSAINHFFFKEYYLSIYQNAVDVFKKQATELFSADSQKLAMINDIIDVSFRLMSNYQIAIWTVSIICGVLIGSVVLSGSLSSIWKFKNIRISFYFVYITIAVLLMFFLPVTKLMAINISIIISFFFLMQGLAVVIFFWGTYLKTSKFFITLLILMMVFNPYISIVIIMTGLFDMWFNFRKINNVEE